MVIYAVGVTMAMGSWELAIQIKLIQLMRWVPTCKSLISVILLNLQHWGVNRCVRFEKMVKSDVGVRTTTDSWAMVIPLKEETTPMKWVTIYRTPIFG